MEADKAIDKRNHYMAPDCGYETMITLHISLFVLFHKYCQYKYSPEPDGLDWRKHRRWVEC
jgi:hypothetical protein